MGTLQETTTEPLAWDTPVYATRVEVRRDGLQAMGTATP